MMSYLFLRFAERFLIKSVFVNRLSSLRVGRRGIKRIGGEFILLIRRHIIIGRILIGLSEGDSIILVVLGIGRVLLLREDLPVLRRSSHKLTPGIECKSMLLRIRHLLHLLPCLCLHIPFLLLPPIKRNPCLLMSLLPRLLLIFFLPLRRLRERILKVFLILSSLFLLFL
jgi:hypothetical protein